MEAYTTMPGAIYRRIVSGPRADDDGDARCRTTCSSATCGPGPAPTGQAAYLAFLGQLDEGYLDAIRDRLPALRVPTRVVWGAADTWIDPASAGRIAALVPGTDVVLLPGAGHFAMEDDPAGVGDAIEGFLDR